MKATQENHIPKKLWKKISEVLARYFYININFCIENLIFPSDLKTANVTIIHRNQRLWKINAHQLAFSLLCLKYKDFE